MSGRTLNRPGRVWSAVDEALRKSALRVGMHDYLLGAQGDPGDHDSYGFTHHELEKFTGLTLTRSWVVGQCRKYRGAARAAGG